MTKFPVQDLDFTMSGSFCIYIAHSIYDTFF